MTTRANIVAALVYLINWALLLGLWYFYVNPSVNQCIHYHQPRFDHGGVVMSVNGRIMDAPNRADQPLNDTIDYYDTDCKSCVCNCTVDDGKFVKIENKLKLLYELLSAVNSTVASERRGQQTDTKIINNYEELQDAIFRKLNQQYECVEARDNQALSIVRGKLDYLISTVVRVQQCLESQQRLLSHLQFYAEDSSHTERLLANRRRRRHDRTHHKLQQVAAVSRALPISDNVRIDIVKGDVPENETFSIRIQHNETYARYMRDIVAIEDRSPQTIPKIKNAYIRNLMDTGKLEGAHMYKIQVYTNTIHISSKYQLGRYELECYRRDLMAAADGFARIYNNDSYYTRRSRKSHQVAHLFINSPDTVYGVYDLTEETSNFTLCGICTDRIIILNEKCFRTALATTMIHEYVHFLHNTHMSIGVAWWYEGLATYIGGQCWPDVYPTGDEGIEMLFEYLNDGDMYVSGSILHGFLDKEVPYIYHLLKQMSSSNRNDLFESTLTLVKTIYGTRFRGNVYCKERKSFLFK